MAHYTAHAVGKWKPDWTLIPDLIINGVQLHYRFRTRHIGAMYEFYQKIKKFSTLKLIIYEYGSVDFNVSKTKTCEVL